MLREATTKALSATNPLTLGTFLAKEQKPSIGDAPSDDTD